MKIVVDTREQIPLWTDETKITKHALKVGDYSVVGHETQFAAERKSAIDLYGSIIQDHVRFRNELIRAQEHKIKLAVFVECTLEEWQKKAFEDAWRVRQTGAVLNKIVSTMSKKYDVPFYFCGNREMMRYMMLTWFTKKIEEVSDESLRQVQGQHSPGN